MLSVLPRAFLALTFSFMFSGPVLAQGGAANYEPERFLILMQGHTVGSLSGSGPSSAFGVRVADVGGVNPAALGAFERPAAGLAYQFETPIEEGYVAGIGYVPLNGARPQSAAVVVPVGAFTLGLSYNQRYAAEMDFGPIPAQSWENPEMDPDLFWDFSWISRVETISPQAAYRTRLRNGADLTFGLRVGIGYGQYENVIDSVAASLSDWGTQVALGTSYRVPGAYGVAAYYESALRVEGVLEREVRFGPGGPPMAISVPHADATPARLGASGEWAMRPSLSLGADVARVFWRSAWGGSDTWRDQNDAALWARLDVSERALVSFGLLSQGRNRWYDEFEEIFDYSGRAIYMTLGGALELDRVRLDAVVADSRLLSADQHKQAVVKVGASVAF